LDVAGLEQDTATQPQLNIQELLSCFFEENIFPQTSKQSSNVGGLKNCLEESCRSSYSTLWKIDDELKLSWNEETIVTFHLRYLTD